MSDAGDRMTRAGNYVLGVMSDDERERAENDMEIDPAFRDAVFEMAERMHVFDRMKAPEEAPQDGWKTIQDRLSSMPHLRQAPPSIQPGAPSLIQAAAAPAPTPPETFGRRRSDAKREPIAPAETPLIARAGLYAVPGRLAVTMAAALMVAFALGYLAGTSTTWRVGTLETVNP